MTLLLPAGPAPTPTALDPITHRAATLTDQDVQALAAAQAEVDVIDRFGALNAAADADTIDLEWSVNAAFNLRPTVGQTSPAQDRLAFEALRDAAMAYAMPSLAPQHHVTLTSAWVTSVR
ncbi:hypothetical protein [Curtobacterium sp. MCSS17_016]|uniref:hypothetical protein n=1 Tax=Curtobacterium sp. MCSS17_016 TaxID=2175644 RepID=UPI000DA960BC|nr:hypothetical protein [Curtobacterium sp. MCSS17_016]WIE81171.1 hypothetical protein DEJ19_018230 [Curtobacterium sp. MCSS17_016]